MHNIIFPLIFENYSVQFTNHTRSICTIRGKQFHKNILSKFFSFSLFYTIQRNKQFTKATKPQHCNAFLFTSSTYMFSNRGNRHVHLISTQFQFALAWWNDEKGEPYFRTFPLRNPHTSFRNNGYDLNKTHGKPDGNGKKEKRTGKPFEFFHSLFFSSPGKFNRNNPIIACRCFYIRIALADRDIVRWI